MAYYVHADWGYDNRRHLHTYLVVQHACGQYLKIDRASEDWSLFEDNIDRYLPQAVHERAKLLENPPLDSLIDIYVKV